METLQSMGIAKAEHKQLCTVPLSILNCREDPNSERLTRERTSMIRRFMPAASSVLEFEDRAKPQGGSRNDQQLANTREPWLMNQLRLLRAEVSLVELLAGKKKFIKTTEDGTAPNT